MLFERILIKLSDDAVSWVVYIIQWLANENLTKSKKKNQNQEFEKEHGENKIQEMI